MSDETVTLELLGARTLALQADVRDLKQRMTGIEYRLDGLENRFSALEGRIGAIEGRISTIEQRLTGMMDLLVRIATRIEA